MLENTAHKMCLAIPVLSIFSTAAKLYRHLKELQMRLGPGAVQVAWSKICTNLPLEWGKLVFTELCLNKLLSYLDGIGLEMA